MSIKKACDDLECAFGEAEAKLDRITEKVDATLAQADSAKSESACSSIGGGQTSYLLKSLKDIKAQHQALTKEINELKENQDAFFANMLEDLIKLENAECALVEKMGFVEK